MILATLDRFGYDLTVLAENEEEAEKLLMEEYEMHFRVANNGDNPREETADDYHTDLSYYDFAKECIKYRELEVGKVEYITI